MTKKTSAVPATADARVEELTEAQAKKPDFIDRVEAAFVASKPAMRFLCKALDLAF